MNIGIVGHEAKKFTPITKAKARDIIYSLLSPGDIIVSGHCHLGGIDIWAEEIANELKLETLIFPPKTLQWDGGYKQRNIQIAENCNEIHNIVVAKYPDSYTGLRFDYCYHCHTNEHIKSGGCWTAKLVEKMGKKAYWHVI